MNRFSLVILSFVAASLSPLVAHAEEVQSATPSSLAPSPPSAPTPSVPLLASPESRVAPANESSEDLATFRAWVATQSGPERTYRFVGGLSGLAVGGALLPAGLVLYSREGTAVTGALVGLGIGSLVGGLGTLAFGSDSDAHDRAERAMDHEKALGHDDAAVLAAGEASLRHSAETQRLERLVGGGICAGLGVVALGWGTAFAAADFTSSSFTRREQDGVAIALLLGGAVSAVTSLQALVLPSVAEVSWQGYGHTKRAKPTAAFAPSAVAFQAMPLPGGGASAGFTGRF